jgi:protein-disulfide isomerase
VQRIAGEAGLDAAAFQTCLSSPAARDALAAQIAEAHVGGVAGTPTLFVNGKRLPRIADFTVAVDKEAARLGLPPISAGPPRR